MVSKDAALQALKPAAKGLLAAHERAEAALKDMMASPAALIFDGSVHGSVVGTLRWAGFASTAPEPMQLVGRRDLTTSPLSRVWLVPSEEGEFRVQMKSDVDEIRHEQLVLFQQEQLGKIGDEARQSLVILTWNEEGPAFLAMEDGKALWSSQLSALVDSAEVHSTERGAPQRTVRGRDVAARKRNDA